MARNDPRERGGQALGQPPYDPDVDTNLAGDPDFADEHDKTAVDEKIITGEDTDREPESPRGWSGGQR